MMASYSSASNLISVVVNFIPRADLATQGFASDDAATLVDAESLLRTDPVRVLLINTAVPWASAELCCPSFVFRDKEVVA